MKRSTVRPAVRLLAAAVALALPLTLAACGESEDDGGRESADSSETTPAEDTSAADEPDAPDAPADPGSTEPLDEWPADVPLVDGTQAGLDLGDGTGGQTGGSGFVVFVVLETAAAEAYGDAAALLTDAGYSSDPADSTVENSGLFRSDRWTVSVSVLPWEKGAVAVQYSVLSAQVF